MNEILKYLDTEAFLKSLPYMGKGMLGIFIITVVIVLCVLIIGKIGNGKNQ